MELIMYEILANCLFCEHKSAFSSDILLVEDQEYNEINSGVSFSQAIICCYKFIDKPFKLKMKYEESPTGGIHINNFLEH